MKRVHARYYKTKNWGDNLNVFLIKELYGKKPKRVKLPRMHIDKYSHLIHTKSKEDYLVVGSTLKFADKNTIVWGTGFISKKNKVISKPKKILAVRGPLTRKLLIKEKIKCPKIFGDPALILPKIYNPKIKKKYDLGIIPHGDEKKNELLKKFKKHRKIKILNIHSGIKKFVRDILKCKKIASSSLHGLIVADTYKIPSIWIEFSKNHKNKKFKFNDYLLSVKKRDLNPLIINSKTTIKDFEKKFKKQKKPEINIKKLLEVCPFK